jgi:hypothetical protein
MLDSPGFDCWQRQEVFIFPIMSILILGLTQFAIQYVAGVFYLVWLLMYAFCWSGGPVTWFKGSAA